MKRLSRIQFLGSLFVPSRDGERVVQNLILRNLQYLPWLDQIRIRDVVRFGECVYGDAELLCDFRQCISALDSVRLPRWWAAALAQQLGTVESLGAAPYTSRQTTPDFHRLTHRLPSRARRLSRNHTAPRKSFVFRDDSARPCRRIDRDPRARSVTWDPCRQTDPRRLSARSC